MGVVYRWRAHPGCLHRPGSNGLLPSTTDAWARRGNPCAEAAAKAVGPPPPSAARLWLFHDGMAMTHGRGPDAPVRDVAEALPPEAAYRCHVFGGDDLSTYDDGRTTSALDRWMRDVVVNALIDVGCPADVADGLAEHAAVRTGKGVTWVLAVHEASFMASRVHVRAEEFEQGAQAVAELLRDASAEAVDRRSRGEDWPGPYWDLPERRPRS